VTPPHFLDRAEAEGALGPRPGEDDAHRVLPLIRRQRAKEAVDRGDVVCAFDLVDPQPPVAEGEAPAGGDDVDGSARYLGPVLGPDHAEVRLLLENLS
jgi:hypothetical protein